MQPPNSRQKISNRSGQPLGDLKTRKGLQISTQCGFNHITTPKILSPYIEEDGNFWSTIRCAKSGRPKNITKDSPKCELIHIVLQVQKYFGPYMVCTLVKRFMPCPFTGPKTFCASPKIWLHLVPLQKLLCWHKNQFYRMQNIFLSGTKCLWLPRCK